ncbi:polysaccharide pyruvyl transferase family protein [Promicromonospora thailandica]|uniref:Pyruvyl transferase n=1 Tax=Promicromonospora thailandica TaxID=765201 RepID=A0A9X2G2J3_9MICO|nr:polysaccharide pyruvyl transferase family protein [Promicromonospora thailandica]MCP2264680.1 pyruvyl transferase [Promicromonospora thailandica]BFF20242.1 polysaccharide pyruvyl transferase family protein [Promicromonospora thailandica]
MPVTVVHWNPRRPVLRGTLGRVVPWRRAVNNFGDLLGPLIVARLVADNELVESDSPRRLLAVGSILNLARAGDVLWGIGANGKTLDQTAPYRELDVRAVRGPLTREFLRQKGYDVPAVYGDPGLLVGRLWPREDVARGTRPRAVTVIPNLHDLHHARNRSDAVAPTTELWKTLAAIAASDLVVGSSLHAIVVAESFGVPARLVSSSVEPPFKYEDYYRGTGRPDFRPAPDVDTAVDWGGEPLPSWDPGPLLAAFPRDLWKPAS